MSPVTGMNVISVFPEKFGQKTKHFQNRTISPCKTHDNFTKNLVQEVELIIMWTTTGNITLLGLVEKFRPNLFVPLVKFLTKGGSKTIQQLKINELFKRVCAEKVTCVGMYLQ